jgi:hypothetical protein
MTLLRGVLVPDEIGVAVARHTPNGFAAARAKTPPST